MVVGDQEPGEVAPGSSEEQKRAERAMLEALSEEIGVPSLRGGSDCRLGTGLRSTVSDDSPVLCEAWVRDSGSICTTGCSATRRRPPGS